MLQDISHLFTTVPLQLTSLSAPPIQVEGVILSVPSQSTFAYLLQISTSFSSDSTSGQRQVAEKETLRWFSWNLVKCTETIKKCCSRVSDDFETLEITYILDHNKSYPKSATALEHCFVASYYFDIDQLERKYRPGDRNYLNVLVPVYYMCFTSSVLYASSVALFWAESDFIITKCDRMANMLQLKVPKLTGKSTAR